MGSKTTPTKSAAATKPAKPAKPPEYGAIACASDGAIYCVETSAGRSAKSSLIVRHAGPGAPAEIVHEHGAKFQGIWVSPEGHVHAASNDGFHHSNESGTWTKARVTKETFLSIGGLDDRFLLASSYPGRLFMRRERGPWQEVLIDGDKAASDWFTSFAGSSASDVYAITSDVLLHFDGSGWRRLASPENGPKTVVVAAPDDVYIATFSGLFRGDATRGFSRVADRKLQHACLHAGIVYCCAYTGGIFRWTGTALEQIHGDDISVWHLDAAKWVCATGMQPGLHTYDGVSWTITHSV